jgi:hypothetical protein
MWLEVKKGEANEPKGKKSNFLARMPVYIMMPPKTQKIQTK